MKIVLDTNILRQDLHFSGIKFVMLLDFVAKTKSEIVIPKIVFQELEAVYSRELSERFNELRRTKNAVEKLLFNLSIQDIKLDLGSETAAFIDFVRKKLGLTARSIIPYQNDYLPNLVDRAVNRKRPLSVNGEEFRDGLMWLSILDYAEAFKDETIAFISNNTKEFGDRDSKLHPELQDEAQKRGVNIIFHSSLDDFIKAHATKYEYINTEWVKESLSRIKPHLLGEIEKHISTNANLRLDDWLKRQDPALVEILKVFPVDFDIDEYYIYEMTDGSMRVAIKLYGELEVEYRAVEEVEDEYWDYDYGFIPENGDFDFGQVLKKCYTEREKIKYAYPEVFVEINLTVVEKEVQGVEVIDWERI
jgi:hypothetical protein